MIISLSAKSITVPALLAWLIFRSKLHDRWWLLIIPFEFWIFNFLTCFFTGDFFPLLVISFSPLNPTAINYMKNANTFVHLPRPCGSTINQLFNIHTMKSKHQKVNTILILGLSKKFPNLHRKRHQQHINYVVTIQTFRFSARCSNI